MKLYLVHCGFYDPDLCEGIYESHTNLFVAAEDFETARIRAREIPIFKSRRMHIDGMEEVVSASGSRIRLEFDPALEGKTITLSNRQRDL